MLLVLSALLLIGSGATAKVGDRCMDYITNTWGVCTNSRQCNSAIRDYISSRILPNFCNNDTKSLLLCCKDGANILQTENQPQNSESKNQDENTGTRRISDKKCVEYTRRVFSFDDISLIPGGVNTKQGEFPHMAALGWFDIVNYAFLCGGSLVSSRFVLTAGHCILNPRMQNPNPVIVRLGDKNIDPSVRDLANPVDVPIKAIHTHPGFKPPSKYNDIALLELVRDVDFSSDIRPACLWSKDTYDGLTQALATGWGVTDPRTRQTSNELQKVTLSILDNSYCERLLSDKGRNWVRGFISSQLCAGELSGGKDTCQGDSGSPLQITSEGSIDNEPIIYVIGITSFGRSCAVAGKAAVYTRVSSYLDWIEAIVWPGE